MALFAKKSLGIDVGASSIKVVEVSLSGNKIELENYIEFKLPITANSIKTFHGDSLLLLSDEVAQILQALLKKAKIKHRKAAISIPDFSTFFTTFDLPPMTEAEIPQAVEFEARHYIPLPLSEVTFDWQVIQKEETVSGVKLKILLVAVSNAVLHNYQRMTDLAQLNVKGMEAEVFGLIRSAGQGRLFKHLPVCMVDIGWQSTTVSIVEKQRLIASYSFDISGIGLTKDLSQTLQIGFAEAEMLKKKFGLDPRKKEVADVLQKQINILALEINKVCQGFYQAEGRRIDNIILSGGTTYLFGLREYLASRIKKRVHIAEPFANLTFPQVLGKRLKFLGPSFAVAVGTAIMGAES